MHIDTARVRDILEEKFDKDQTKILTQAFDTAFEDGLDSQLKILATKEDIGYIKAELKEKATKEDIANLKVELIEKIVDNKAEIIKWMFIFWIAQLGFLGGLIFTMLKLFFG